MTGKSERTSLVSRRRSTPEGVYSMAAAKLGLRLVGLLNAAQDAVKVQNVELASRLDISEGRVSQVMSGDGNIRVATLGRFLRALGYELELRAVPMEAGVPTVAVQGPGTSRRRRRSMMAPSRYDFFEQMFATPSGVSSHLSVVRRPRSVSTCPVPLGAPRQAGTATVAPAGVRFEFPSGVGDWETEINDVVDPEGSSAEPELTQASTR